MLYPKLSACRQVSSLNGIWDFAVDREGYDFTRGFEAEKKVAVPASFNDLFTEDDLRNRLAAVWYARSFRVPGAWRNQRVVLRFGSVTYRARVYLNGHALGAHETGYTPFEFDIGRYIEWDGANRLVVRIDQELSPETIPQGQLKADGGSGQIGGQYPDAPFDFFPYSGIHRNVMLYTTHATTWIDQLRIDTRIDGHDGIITLDGECCGNPTRATVTTLETGKQTEALLEGGTIRARVCITDVKCWDIGQPNFYHLQIRLFNESGQLVDEYIQRAGVREIKVVGDRFLLNGKPVYFTGFGKHEDFSILGKGHSDAVNVRDFELMNWLHANSFRTSHYPYAEELLDLADEYGLLVISETPAVSINFDYANERTLATHLQALDELIARDRNHPSVVMWSVANEPRSNQKEARPYFEQVAARCRELDDTRPMVLVSCFPKDDVTLDLFDVVCLNAYPGWYYLPGQIDAAKQALDILLDKAYKRFKKPIFMTEFGADTMAGFHGAPAELWTEEYQKDLLLALIDVMRGKDYVIGEHIWAFADFRTSQNYFRASGNRKGVFTRERQPKLICHYLREVWETARYEK